MPRDSSNIDNAVIRAEAMFTSFLVEHNIALSAADHAAKLFNKMFVVPGVNPQDIIKRFGQERKWNCT